MKRLIGKLFCDSRGGVALEYGFILALIVTAMMVALATMANITVGMWNDVADNVTHAG